MEATQKKPVYALVQGDVFITENRRKYTVQDIQKPDNWASQMQIGETPKAWTIVAKRHEDGKECKFHHHNAKLMDVVIKDTHAE